MSVFYPLIVKFKSNVIDFSPDPLSVLLSHLVVNAHERYSLFKLSNSEKRFPFLE